MFVLPFQNPAEEFFAAEIASSHPLIFAQPFLDCRLRANSSVIHPRQPHHFPPLHPRMPRQNILDGSVKDVTERENAIEVWGWYNNRERRLRRFGIGMKCLCVEPALIPFWLDCFRIVSFRQLRHERGARFRDGFANKRKQDFYATLTCSAYTAPPLFAKMIYSGANK